MKYYCAIVVALPAALAISADVLAAEPAPAQVAACGLEFDLPAGYKITRPQRSTHASNGRQCAFDIVPARPQPPPRGECKDEDDGGQPPYEVCDWLIDAGPSNPKVKVVRARLQDHPDIDPFRLDEDGQWVLPNAQAGDQPAESTDFFGKPAWKGETIVRLYWWRERTKDYTGIYAGSGGSDVTLVQLAPDLFVQLENPPLDTNGDCTTFCASLRLGKRVQDLP